MLGETDRLRKEVFSPRLPHPNWVDWVVGNDKFQAKGENNRALSSWEREEMGITRPPSAVIALMLQSSGRRSGLVEEACRAREFQHECFLAARRKPECVAGPLGDYGSIILTSYRPGATTAQARLEVREKIRTFREELEKRFGMTVLAGAGFLRAGSLDLARSYRAAVAGLHLAVQAGRNPTFVEATVNEREGVPTAGLRASVRELADAMSRASQDRLAISRDKFIRQVLFASHGQSEVARIHCLSALYILLERFEGKSGVSLNAARTLGDDLADRVASAGNLPDLMAAFTGAMEALERYQEKPREAGTAARVEQVLKDIELEPGKPWKLHEICKRTGMSTPTFLKWFRKLTGSGFGPFLRKARLTKARQMLQEGPLTLERIAQECGFNSASYLIQAFKRTMGTSPRKYKHWKTGV
jgi:AraC-like DNA-binding protein